MPTWPAQLGTKIFTSHHLLLETRWCEELILFLARHQRWRRRNDGGGAPHILFLTQYHSLSCRMASVEACTQSAQMELIFVRPVLSCPALTHFSWLYHAGIMCWFNKTAGVLFTFLLWISVLGVYICIPWGGTGTYPVLYNIITYWIKQHHAQLDRKPWEEVEVLWAAGSLETALHHHVSRLIKPAAISWHVYQTNGVICSSDWLGWALPDPFLPPRTTSFPAFECLSGSFRSAFPNSGPWTGAGRWVIWYKVAQQE